MVSLADHELAITLPIPNSVVVAFKLRMPEQCAERQRLGRKVAEAVSAVYALKDRENATKGKKDAALSLQLDQARTAQRMTEHALRDHIREHGCMVEKT